MSIPTVTAQLLTSADFEPFGQVIQFDNETVQANQGTARRRNYLAKLWNGRPETATPNMCIFRVQPAAKLPFPVRLLERHPHSTQAFIPMGNQEPLDCRYLVIVCSGGSDDKPDLTKLKAFVAGPHQGINYKPGCWHHPIISLKQRVDFLCLVWEAQEPADCEEVFFTNKEDLNAPPALEVLVSNELMS